MFLSHKTRVQGQLIIATVAALLVAVPAAAFAQSSPLTVQPSTGRVGVGTASPAEKLDVVGGNIKTSGFFIGNGSQLTNLPGGGGSAALDKVTANTTVANTAAETNFYSFSVAGGTLSTNNMLRLTIQVTDLDINDGNNCVLRLKYGGTTLASINISNNTGTGKTNIRALVSLIIAADGATNAQLGSVFFHATSTFGPNVAQGTSAVDSTAAQTFAVTADWDSAAAGNSITLGQAILEKIS